MKRPANIRIMRTALALAAAVSVSALLVGAGQAQVEVGQAPAIGQAPVAVGQVPAEVGQAPVAIGQAPASSAAPADASAAPAAPAAGDKPVSYSNDQADRGEKRFKATCADCHGDDLQGGLIGGPPLKGNAFDEAFANGAPASALFSFMSTQMPPDSPGQFSASVYADVMAYVLKRNGYQAGAALPSDSDALDHLIMQK